MSIWQTVTWNVARTGGFTGYILLTLAVAIGLALTMHLQSPSYWPRLINSELHNFVTLLSVVFVGIHILAVWVDPSLRLPLHFKERWNRMVQITVAMLYYI